MLVSQGRLRHAWDCEDTPYNSWKDPAEHVMSVLNLGVQAVDLMHEKTDIKNLVSTCSGLKMPRKLHEENPALSSKILRSLNSGNSGPLLLGPNCSAWSTLCAYVGLQQCRAVRQVGQAD